MARTAGWIGDRLFASRWVATNRALSNSGDALRQGSAGTLKPGISNKANLTACLTGDRTSTGSATLATSSTSHLLPHHHINPLEGPYDNGAPISAGYSSRSSAPALSTQHFLPSDVGPATVFAQLIFAMAASNTPDSCPLLSLPVELREVILRYAFRCVPHIRLRSPSRRRLRPARVDKNDPRSLLGACRTLRDESIPVFYNTAALIFHSSIDAIEYLQGPDIDPFVKANLTHLAMDDGDCQCMATLLQKHLWLVGNAFEVCPSLNALEFRIYLRHDNPEIAAAARDLIDDWGALAANCTFNAGHGNGVTLTKRIRPDHEEAAEDAIDRLVANDHDIRIVETRANYSGGSTTVANSSAVILSCCNVMVDKNGRAESVLGQAEAAVERRKAQAGAISHGSGGFDTDTRCPDRMEIVFVKELEDGVRAARPAAQRGVGRHAWSTTRMSDQAPMAATA